MVMLYFLKYELLYGCSSLVASTDLNMRSLETGVSGKEALGCGAASGRRVSRSSRGGCTRNAGTKRPGSQCSESSQGMGQRA